MSDGAIGRIPQSRVVEYADRVFGWTDRYSFDFFWHLITRLDSRFREWQLDEYKRTSRKGKGSSKRRKGASKAGGGSDD